MKSVFITMSYISGKLVHVYWFGDFINAVKRAQAYTASGLQIGDTVLTADRVEIFHLQGMDLEEFEAAIDNKVDELGLDPFGQEYRDWLLNYVQEKVKNLFVVASAYRV